MKNTLTSAHRNEMAVLILVHRYGHVRKQDIARAIWPRSSEKSALVMAHRTIDRLLKKKNLIKIPNTIGGTSYTLRAQGANRLEGAGVLGVKSGRGISSISGPQFFHRTLGTRYLIEKGIDDLEAYGEYAIYRGLFGIDRNLFVKKFKKVPDGLLLVPGAQRGMDPEFIAADWVEVESFYKPPREIRKILDLSMKTGEWLDQSKKIMLDRAIFVQSTLNSHEESLHNSIESYINEHKISNPELLEKIVIAKCNVELPFVWKGMSERTWLSISQEKGKDVTKTGA